jgi:hypothetical protein
MNTQPMTLKVVITENYQKLPRQEKHVAELVIETIDDEFFVRKNRYGLTGYTAPRDTLGRYLLEAEQEHIIRTRYWDEREKAAGKTMERGLEIQSSELAEWKPRLSDECYKDLVAFAEDMNAATRQLQEPTLYDVCRGDTLRGYICSWKP